MSGGHDKLSFENNIVQQTENNIVQQTIETSGGNDSILDLYIVTCNRVL